MYSELLVDYDLVCGITRRPLAYSTIEQETTAHFVKLLDLAEVVIAVYEEKAKVTSFSQKRIREGASNVRDNRGESPPCSDHHVTVDHPICITNSNRH